MIDEINKIIYIDNSTRSVFNACKEKCRLGNVLGYRPKITEPSLSFGHAFHAAWAAYYDALAGGWHDADGVWWLYQNVEPSPIDRAQAAFLRDLGHTDAKLPINIENEERRSLERGLYLIEAYVYRWKNEPYENLLIDGIPQTEVGFRYYITQWEDYKIYYVGYIDRLMINIMTKRPVIFEGKTTIQGLSQYILQCKPNDQITGYFPAALDIAPGITECVWDCVFVSDRMPNMKKGLTDRFWTYGINTGDDFKRQVTTRSQSDITEFKIDLEEDIISYCNWLTSGKTRWPRTTGACHAFGGCRFRTRCMVNIDQEQEKSFMESFFKQEKWEPWRKIVERLADVENAFGK